MFIKLKHQKTAQLLLLFIIVLLVGVVIYRAGKDKERSGVEYEPTADQVKRDCVIEEEQGDEEVEKYQGVPEVVDFTTMPKAQTFNTVITEVVASGPNFAGHFTLVHWGCGTDCFGYAAVDVKTGEIIAYSAANENYHLEDYSLGSRVFVMEPVYKGQERKYYKVIEEDGESRLELVCTEISTQDMFR